MPAELRFDAMGTTCHVAVTGDAGLLVFAQERLEVLESRWSRVRPDSEISRLRAHSPLAVSADTCRLVETACAAWRLTSGRYDPTVIDAVEANGYDRTFTELSSATAPSGPAVPAPGCAGIEAREGHVTLPPGVGLDPGGIGKGLAADMLTAELLGRGARGALVDLGGDIRCAGEGPENGSWVVDVADPFGKAPLLHLAFGDGAIATSSRLRRRWGHHGAWHHIVDPATGEPASTDIVSATVIAAEAWWAEAVATAVMVAGDVSVATNASVIAVRADGSLTGTAQLLEMAA